MAKAYQLAMLGQAKLILDNEEIYAANIVVLTPETCVLESEHNKLPALVIKSLVIDPPKYVVV